MCTNSQLPNILGTFFSEVMHNVIHMNVKQLREAAGLTQQELSNSTGIPRDRIASWERGRGNPKSEDSKILDDFFRGLLPKNYSPSDIYSEVHHSKKVAEPAESYTEHRRIKKSLFQRQRIPLFDAPAAAGITEQDMTPVHAPSGTIDVGDLLHDSESAIRIYGNSMIPNYPPGCVVGLVKCSSDFIEPGEVYVIETRDRRLLKRVFYKNDDTSGDALHLYSDNIMKFEGGARDGRLAYPPFDLPKSEIIALYQVTGVIKRNSNSVILNR